VWLASDEAAAERLERELAAGGDHRLIFTIAEVEAMRGMLAADMQTLVNIKHRLPGSHLDHVILREGQADA
jgi:thiamine monophosphate kinase